MKYLICTSLFLTACSSMSKKSICSYSGDQPNARYVVVGSCLKTKGTIRDVKWVEQNQKDGIIEQGHFVIETVPSSSQDTK